MNKSMVAKAFNLQDSFTITSTSGPTESFSGAMDIVAFPGSNQLYIKVFYKAICLKIRPSMCKAAEIL